ncbi:SUKH-4 family immunity protein [Nocardia sp. NPDC052566]|uniref:SUKH-4 family immunity protein n=1 Tax=Nocardia sp. NPDC052566 TaxID=3364330 RepID=UPI0037C79BD4
MIDHWDYLEAWGDDNIIRFPRSQWIEEFPVPSEAYPDVDFIPIDMSVVFTSYLDGGRFDLYDQINLRLSDDEVMPLIVIGAVPENPDSALFAFEANGGRVVLLGVDEGALELVNSTFKALAEFLFHFARFVDEDTGIDGRARRATKLLEILRGIDEAAFKNPESWWAIALSKLGATSVG